MELFKNKKEFGFFPSSFLLKILRIYVIKWYNKLSKSPRFKGWTIFEQPHINSMKPDFILFH